jgi:O-antigen/teichoic acid export membrane protein
MPRQAAIVESVRPGPELAEGPAPATDAQPAGASDFRRRAAGGIFVNSAFQLGLVAASALRGVVVAAFLTRSDYGIWGIVSLTLWTALSLKTVFGASDKYIQQSDDDQEDAFQRAFTVEVIFAAVIAPVAVAVVFGSAYVAGHRAILAPGLVMLLMLPSIALQFPIATFYRRMQFRRQRKLQAVEPLVGAVVMVTLAVLGAGYWSFVLGALAGSWASAVVTVRASPYKLRWRYHRGTLGSYVKFSLPLLISSASMLAVFQVVMLVGVKPLGLAGLGAYTLVGNVVQFTDQADNIVTETLYPAVCAVSNRTSLLTEIFVKTNRLALMWAVPFGIGVALFASDLAHFVLGPRWGPAVPLLEIMGVVTALNHVGYNWSAFVKSRGKTWPMAVLAVVVSAVVIATAIPLMYSDGVVGIGYAFGIGTLVGLVMRSVALHRFFSGVRPLRHLIRAFAPTLVAVLPVLAARAVFGPDPSLVSGLGLLALYLGVTAAATFFFERSLIAEVLGYLRQRKQGTAEVVADAGSGRSPVQAVLDQDLIVGAGSR